jgi:hypothetical protein
VRNIDFGGIATDKLTRVKGLQNNKQEAERRVKKRSGKEKEQNEGKADI